MSILVVGSVAYDTVETPFGRAEKVLGGSASFFSVAASFFAPVNLVAVVGDDFSAKAMSAFEGFVEQPDCVSFGWKYMLQPSRCHLAIQAPMRSSPLTNVRVLVSPSGTIATNVTCGAPVTSVQNAGSAVLRPFEIAATRVARPFHDAYSWFDGLLHARSDQKKLRAENERLRQLNVQNEFAASEAKQLKALLAFREGPTFPGDFNPIAASVISRPTGAFAQAIVVSAGSADGVELLAPVVTGDGLIGLVTRVTTHASRVTLLTDEQSAVSALDAKTDQGQLPRRPGADAPGEYDPRLTLAVDLYNRGLALGLATKDGKEVDLSARQLSVPFGSLDLSVEPEGLNYAGNHLTKFVSLADLEVRGLRNTYRRPGIGVALSARVNPTPGGAATCGSRPT
jgi:hypothetical protein